MEIFLLLLKKIFPLYLVVLAGFIAGKKFNVRRESIATLLIYFIVPTVIVIGISQTQLTIAYLSIPFLFFIACTLMALLFLWLGQWIYPHNRVTRNILAFGAGDGNTGYFGLPVAIQLFGAERIGLAILCLVGFVVYENSIGFYIAARGKHSAQEALKRLFKLPTVYAFTLGIILSLTGHPIGGVLSELGTQARGAYSILGMMLIGLGAAAASTQFFSIKIDWKFVGFSFLAKFIVWPLLALAIVSLDQSIFHFFDAPVHQMMILISSVPLAANTIAFSTELDAEPDKVAVAVLLSTALALAIVPLLGGLALKISN